MSSSEQGLRFSIDNRVWVMLSAFFFAVAGYKIGNYFAIWSEPAGYFFELFEGDFFDARLGCGADGGIEMYLIRMYEFYRLGEFGNLCVISIKTLDEEDLKPYLTPVFLS